MHASTPRHAQTRPLRHGLQGLRAATIYSTILHALVKQNTRSGANGFDSNGASYPHPRGRARALSCTQKYSESERRQCIAAASHRLACQRKAFGAKRHRGDSNPCGQSPMDFESISLAARTQCLCHFGASNAHPCAEQGVTSATDQSRDPHKGGSTLRARAQTHAMREHSMERRRKLGGQDWLSKLPRRRLMACTDATRRGDGVVDATAATAVVVAVGCSNNGIDSDAMSNRQRA